MIVKNKDIPLLTFFIQIFVNGIATTNETNSNYLGLNSGAKLLSRRKRFLIFPDGSSFQLVFCVQTSALITIGDIFLYGNTAALAWSLPTDPKFFTMFKGYDKEALRRGDFQNSIYYVDDKGQLIAKAPYKRKVLVNPAFAKRSVDEGGTFKEKLRARIDRNKMHEKQVLREYLKKEHLDKATIDFHRNSRVDLIEKVEKLLTALRKRFVFDFDRAPTSVITYSLESAMKELTVLYQRLGQDGRQCVLYKLCEAAQSAPRQGTFLQEFFRIVFTLPKGTLFDKMEHREYDDAHRPTDDCWKLYPGCEYFDIPETM